jgi:tripartite-type tricarboxylate transporter receptor subunit TctC
MEENKMLSARPIRDRSLRLAAAGAAIIAILTVAGLPSRAEDYPSRNITLVVPSPPGGGTDTQARILAPKLGQLLGKTIVIENRPGASGNIGAQAAVKAAPDGYTLLAMISSHVINPFVLKDVPYNLDKDFAMISRTVTVPGVLVGNPSLPAKNLPELLAHLKASPGKVAYGSAGIGSLSHLIVELFEQDAGVKLLHVPYRGTHPALNDTISGQVSLDVPDLTIVMGQIEAGQLRAFGVTSAQRSAVAPNIPTLAEQGVAGFDAVQWFGLCAPAGTPAPIVAKLHDAVVKALNDPDVKAAYAKLAMTPAPSASPAEYAKFVHDEGVRWGKVVKDANIAVK